MPVIVLEARDLASPLFLVRTCEVLCGCVTLSLAASLDASELSGRGPPHLVHSFRVFCMFSWCLFFALTFLIHALAAFQFHSLVPVSWKNLTVTVAALGALTCLSASVVFPWIVMAQERPRPRPVAAAVASCLTCLAYAAELHLLRRQAPDQRGYMGSAPGLLKVLQLWGGVQMVVLVADASLNVPAAHGWRLWASSGLYAACVLTAAATLVVILGDLAGRCPLPFDRLLAAFGLLGVLLYMVATVMCFTQILQLRDAAGTAGNAETVVMETVIACITLLAYTVDLAFSIKQICDRSHA